MASRLVSRLALTLTEHGIPYMLIGGQAVLLYGEPRLTKDVDVTLGIPPSDLERLLRVVASLKLKILVDNVEDFVRQTAVLPCHDSETGLRVDFVFSWSAYERAALERVRIVEVRGTPVSYASPEDVVVHKMIAGRPRDLEDVFGIMVRNPDIDLDYVRDWLARFDDALAGDLLARLQSVLDDVDPAK